MNELINKITPGNYWLTKSMEFNRVQTSGTLWYLKKWLVYYYYIFMKDNIYIKDYNEIKIPYSYEHKNNKILIPTNCLIKS